MPDDCARILLKVESENPTGGMKDRMALAMIEAAEADGRLQLGGHVIEYTGGSTGVSLAFICAVKRYTASIVTSDAFSVEKRNQMKAFGAELTIIPSPEGKTTEGLTRDMIEAARARSRKRRAASGPTSWPTRTRSRPTGRWVTKSRGRPMGAWTASWR